MILELDCGNTLLKWRVLGDSGEIVTAGTAADLAELLARLESTAVEISWARMVSVRGDEETAELVVGLEGALDVDVAVAVPAQVLAGVTNGYEDWRRLGLDRWLALVAGYQLAPGGCLVLDLGTAITADFVSAEGVHLGGFICPGLALMAGQLKGHTRRIRYESSEMDEGILLRPGTSTAEAVGRGGIWMIRGFVLEQVRLAKEWLGDEVQVLITGGDAEWVAGVYPAAWMVKDLVFCGLAIACPVKGE